MTTLESIDTKIKQLEEKIKNCKGTEADVYTRIVGYYRSVKNWNKGKKEEYRQRKTFVLDKSKFKED